MDTTGTGYRLGLATELGIGHGITVQAEQLHDDFVHTHLVVHYEL
jgi:hypothetical protein